MKILNKFMKFKSSKYFLGKRNPPILLYLYPIILLSVLLLVAAPNTLVNDTGDSQIYTDNSSSVVFNCTATPIRQDFNNNGLVQMNITSSETVNKTFKIIMDDKQYTTMLNGNNSNNITSDVFTTENSINKTITVLDPTNNNTINLNVNFENIKLINYDITPNTKTITITQDTPNGIQEAINNSNDGDTIILKNGIYKQCNITVNKGVTIKAETKSGAIIDAEGQGRIFNVTNTNAVLDGLNITNGEAPNISVGGGDGGGVYLNGGSVTNSTITNCNSTHGGGIYINNGNVTNSTITNCTNRGGDGGGVYLNGGSVTNSTITNCTGGGINLNNGNVTNSTITNCTSDRYGGGINLNNGGVTNSTITNCHNGGVYINNDGSVTNSTITNCTGYGCGGVYINNDGSVTNSTITNCNAYYGWSGASGGIHLNNDGNVTNSTITNCTSDRYGGGIHLNNDGNVTNSTITNCASYNRGGGVYLNGGGSLMNSTITNCTSSNEGDDDAWGGGVCLDGSGNVTGCTITNCTSDHCGGIFLNGSGSVSYCRIVDNNALDGKEAYINNSGSADFNWWGANNITQLINGSVVPSSYYQLLLTAGNVSTVDEVKDYFGMVPISLGCGLVLNGTDDSTGSNNLPDFTGNTTLSNVSSHDLLLFRDVVRSFTPGKSNSFNVPNGWNDTLNSQGRYNYTGVVDNQILDINIIDKDLKSVNLVISKTCNVTNVVVGDVIGYTIKVVNNGMVSVANVTVNDTMSNDLKYINSNSNNGDYNSNSGLWSIPILGVGEIANLNMTCRVVGVGDVINSAHLFLGDNNYINVGVNDSSVMINSKSVLHPGDDSNLFWSGLPLTGLPLVVLILFVCALFGYFLRRR
ncbi:MAG: DUF11 domain-containing protein [Methanobrevibacter sp.]|jgi:hypothetical protein|nr:DUF11 domain-containing protein [Candidatus Methanovirga aequatorialis]